MKQHRWFLAAMALAVATAVTPGQSTAQERGSISGTVVDQATRQPLVGAQILIAGTNLGTLTNQQGRFIILNVPSGAQEIRATLIGYGQVTQPVVVAPGATATVNLALAPAAVALEGVIVTTTGQVQRRREVGNTVATINVAEVELAPIQNFSQLLQGRAPGVSVMQSAGTTGTGARIRVRGSTSISLSNEPLLIVDGVRVDNAPQSFAVGLGGQSVSRLNDINPEDIERIEVLKGPAAAALYGTAAANGVIQITTRRGRAGITRWGFYSELGTLQERTQYPANYDQRGRLLSGPNAGVEVDNCNVIRQARNICEPLGLNSFNPLMVNSPFRDGALRTFGLNVAGGSDQVQFYVSGETQGEDGIYANNFLNRANMRGNLTAQLRPNFDMALRTGYVSSTTRLPLNDNSASGFVSAGLLGDAFDSERTGGYFSFANDRRFALERLQGVERLFGSAEANFRPLTWLAVNGTAGMDVLSRNDFSAVAPGIWLPSESANDAMGNRAVFSALVRNYTARVNGIATFQPAEGLVLTTTAGTEYLEDRFQRYDAGGFNMLPGAGSLGALSERFFVNEFDRTTITISGLMSQQLAWNDRLYLTGALRGDRNSNFGGDFGFTVYPSLSASWVVAEEPWFPQVDAISSLRLRGAVGQSGLQPNFRTAEPFFTPVTATVNNVSVPAITLGGPGNPALRPERARELEVGVDMGLLADRVGVEFSYYNKRSTDALVNRRLAPSLGSSTFQTVNLGSVSNSGFEALLNTQLLRLPRVRLDATLSLATNRNELLELGEGIEPIIFGIGGSSQRHTEGFPLGSYFGRQLLGFADTNGDGLIGPNEVEIGTTTEFLGRPFPTREIALSSGITLFNTVRISALIDHKGGHQLFNATEEFRCRTWANCRGLQDRSAPLAEQARAVAAAEFAVIDGYIENADFTKLREVSVSIGGLERFTRGIALNTASLTLSGRNLGTWTRYSGFDPEINSGGQDNFGTYDFLGQPPIRTFTARIDIGF